MKRVPFVNGRYSTGHGHCSTYTRVNCVQYGGFPRKIHANNSREGIFMVTNFPYKNTRKLRVFLNNSKCGWCKIGNRHHGKTLFLGEKENNLQYTFSYYDHATIANVMFCNQRFPWLLHGWSAILHVNLDACYLPRLLFWNRFRALACVAGAQTSVHCFFLDLFMIRT